MSKEGSVAPKERVNITYKPATGDAQEQRELPFKILAIGDYTGRPDDRPVEDRKPLNIDKDNFNEVMAEHKLGAKITVEDRLSGEAGAEMAVDLRFSTLKDFTPEGIAHQVPELKQLLQLREALTALKGPLGNIPGFRKKIQTLLADDAARERLMKELGMADGGSEGEQ
jgi:type VI secretion system protein ImpB